jgi:hypothetical protein
MQIQYFVNPGSGMEKSDPGSGTEKVGSVPVIKTNGGELTLLVSCFRG